MGALQMQKKVRDFRGADKISRSLFRPAEGFGQSLTLDQGPVLGPLVNACYKEWRHLFDCLL